jgi:hypothetical protein
LVINRGLCEALAVIRGVATPGQVEQEQPAITSHESTEGRRTENNVVLNSEARDTARERELNKNNLLLHMKVQRIVGLKIMSFQPLMLATLQGRDQEETDLSSTMLSNQ